MKDTMVLHIVAAFNFFCALVGIVCLFLLLRKGD